MSELGEIFSVATHGLLANNENLLKFLKEVALASPKN